MKKSGGTAAPDTSSVAFTSSVLVCGLLSAPIWCWLAIRRGADRELAIWSTVVALIIAIPAAYLGWRLALRTK
jgi:hypothetical protein